MAEPRYNLVGPNTNGDDGVAVRKRILVCWIGHNDLRAMAASFTGEKRDELLLTSLGEAKFKVKEKDRDRLR